jgi:hypothetical protein
MQEHAQALAPPPRPPHREWLPWIATATMAGACAVLAVLLGQQASRLNALESALAQARIAPAASAPAGPSEAAPDDAAAGDAAAPAARNARPTILAVPYGVEPFSGPRLDALRQLFDRLESQGFQGTVDIRAGTGRFCLVGNASEGFSLAPDDLPYARCDVVAGAGDAAASVRLPVAMADLMGTVRTGSHDMIHVQVSNDSANLAAYPPPADSLTAGEWNRAAQANNRIEIRLR